MSDFEDKLNTILSSPEAMSQIAAIASSLGGDSKPKEPEETAPPPPAEPSGGDSADLSSFGNLGNLGNLGIDPGMLTRLLPLVSQLNVSQNDQRAQLLYALRPFLKPERRGRIDEALRLARLFQVGKSLLNTLGGESHG